MQGVAHWQEQKEDRQPAHTGSRREENAGHETCQHTCRGPARSHQARATEDPFQPRRHVFPVHRDRAHPELSAKAETVSAVTPLVLLQRSWRCNRTRRTVLACKLRQANMAEGTGAAGRGGATQEEAAAASTRDITAEERAKLRQLKKEQEEREIVRRDKEQLRVDVLLRVSEGIGTLCHFSLHDCVFP